MMDEPHGLVEVMMSCPFLMKLLTTHLITAPSHTAEI